MHIFSELLCANQWLGGRLLCQQKGLEARMSSLSLPVCYCDGTPFSVLTGAVASSSFPIPYIKGNLAISYLLFDDDLMIFSNAST